MLEVELLSLMEALAQPPVPTKFDGIPLLSPQKLQMSQTPLRPPSSRRPAEDQFFEAHESA